jgi:hypothetical protein
MIVHYLFHYAEAQGTESIAYYMTIFNSYFLVLSVLPAARDRTEPCGAVFHQPGFDLIEIL